MELKTKFDIMYMVPALIFLESLPEKVQDKISFNISKSRYYTDKDLLKKTDSQYLGIQNKVSRHDVSATGILG